MEMDSSSDMSSEENSFQATDDNDNSVQFIPGSPVSTPYSNNIQQTLFSIAEDAATQLRAVTLPNDKGQLQFLESLKSIQSPVNTISSLLDFLIEKVTASSLDVTKMYKEMQTAKDEAKISESKASRLLLHLQQNIKLLSRVATNNGETTLVQEAAQNVQSISQLDSTIPPDYVRQLKDALSNKKDPKVQVEIFELLKQEISINTVLRRQTQQFEQKSSYFNKAIEDIKKNFEINNIKNNEKMKKQIKKHENFIKQLCTLCNCDETHIPETIQKYSEQAKRNKASIDLLSKKIQQMKTDQESQLSSLMGENSDLKNEINILNHQLTQYETAQKAAQKTRMKIYEVLGIQADAKSTEIEALTFAANKAIPIVQNYNLIKKNYGVDPSKFGEQIRVWKEEIAKLKSDRDKKITLLEKQAATIAELQDKTWKNWGINGTGGSNSIDFSSAHSIDDQRSSNEQSPISANSSTFIDNNNNNVATDLDYDDINDADSHFGQINELKQQFSSIERELQILQSNMIQDNEV